MRVKDSNPAFSKILEWIGHAMWLDDLMGDGNHANTLAWRAPSLPHRLYRRDNECMNIHRFTDPVVHRSDAQVEALLQLIDMKEFCDEAMYQKLREFFRPPI